MASVLMQERKFHLFVFYKTLVFLYFNKNAVASIEKAIADCDEPIS